MVRSITIYDGYLFLWWDHVLTRDSSQMEKPTNPSGCFTAYWGSTPIPPDRQKISHLCRRENGVDDKCFVQTGWITDCSNGMKNRVSRIMQDIIKPLQRFSTRSGICDRQTSNVSAKDNRWRYQWTASINWGSSDQHTKHCKAIQHPESLNLSYISDNVKSHAHIKPI